MSDDKPHILDFDRAELQAWFRDQGLPAYRADQVLQWVYEHGVTDPAAMSNLPADLRGMLQERLCLLQGKTERVSRSSDGTTKILIRWPDDALTEVVMIPEKERRTVCVSSQVGCPVGCRFCASGLEGLQRSLRAGEIVEQLFWVRANLPPGERISNIVMMGMGEPLANYQNVLKAVHMFNAEWGFGIGARHITVSTVGLPERIRRLAHEPLQVTLAVSLHAGNEEVRKEIIPWAQRTTTEELFEAIHYFYEQTHREVTLEYILLDDVNTSDADADLLARWARRTRCNVNLINYNEVPDLPYRRASSDKARAFKQRLARKGINAHIRPSRGRDIDAACGQLRRRQLHTITPA